MKHPSIRLRLTLGTGVAAALVMLIANVLIYRAMQRTLEKEIRVELYRNALLLAKSSEMEPDGVVYEWHEALESMHGSNLAGLFQFWDVNNRKSVRSPDLGNADLPLFHGKLNQPLLREITLADGKPALAIGLLHHPFLDEESRTQMERAGKVLKPSDHPQVLVCARETASLHSRLDRLSGHLVKASIAAVAVVWLTMWAIVTFTLRPIHDLTQTLLRRSSEERTPLPEIPPQLPRELTGLARAFNTALTRVEAARSRERDFALHAAHELRTPVAGIRATLEQAVHRPRQASELETRIRNALEICDGMSVTLDGLMRLARLRGGIEPVTPGPFDGVACLRELWEATAPLAAHRGLAWRFAPERPSIRLASDQGLWRVMATNLIENAARHAPAGTWAELRAWADDGGFHFEITNDRGTLSPEEGGNLFEPFARARSAGGNEPGHAGLGLSLAREVARLLGGRLAVSFPGESTVRFTATVPAANIPDQSP